MSLLAAEIPSAWSAPRRVQERQSSSRSSAQASTPRQASTTAANTPRASRSADVTGSAATHAGIRWCGSVATSGKASSPTEVDRRRWWRTVLAEKSGVYRSVTLAAPPGGSVNPFGGHCLSANPRCAHTPACPARPKCSPETVMGKFPRFTARKDRCTVGGQLAPAASIPARTPSGSGTTRPRS
eukprot:1028859-Prorocentrum_minimum.AAC.2